MNLLLIVVMRKHFSALGLVLVPFQLYNVAKSSENNFRTAALRNCAGPSPPVFAIYSFCKNVIVYKDI